MTIHGLPSLPRVNSSPAATGPASPPSGDRFERTALAEAFQSLPPVARGAALGLTTVSPPLLGGVGFGPVGALAGGAAAFGIHYALDRNPRRALLATATPTLLGGLLGVSAAGATPLRLAGAAALGVMAGIAAVLREDQERGPAGPIVSLNAPGQRVEVEQRLVPGKLNIVSFSADWCPACEELKPGLESFVTRNSQDHVLLKVDIDRWKSPVAQQYGLKSIPQFRIYDGQGHLVAQGEEARAQVEAWAGQS